jgi:hypothetical protein
LQAGCLRSRIYRLIFILALKLPRALARGLEANKIFLALAKFIWAKALLFFWNPDPRAKARGNLKFAKKKSRKFHQTPILSQNPYPNTYSFGLI